ncbi:hypothetical protein [Vibrio palustris]|uniref:Uncharacterized protein n=1 Tax=Vibrio palustris TaxID=1918946 RepID=A0A1R4B5D4_9VIBR|nr:hypothetical protein [Vibrio palustris]SJL84113.1 hypothetical protein VPAL9027_02094 [Vibrio palustris]
MTFNYYYVIKPSALKMANTLAHKYKVPDDPHQIRQHWVALAQQRGGLGTCEA